MIQREIVRDLDGYQKIIDGARQVVDNYKPSVEIRLEYSDLEISAYEEVNIIEVSTFFRGVTYKKADEVHQGGIKILRANNVSLDGKLVLDEVKAISESAAVRNDQWLKPHDILMCIASGSKGHIGKTALIKENVKFAFGGFMGVLRTSEKILPEFLYGILQQRDFNTYLGSAISGANINNIKKSILAGFKFPLPPMEIQRSIVNKMEEQSTIVNGNTKLIEIYTKKIQDRIAKVWGD